MSGLATLIDAGVDPGRVESLLRRRFDVVEVVEANLLWLVVSSGEGRASLAGRRAQRSSKWWFPLAFALAAGLGGFLTKHKARQ